MTKTLALTLTLTRTLTLAPGYEFLQQTQFFSSAPLDGKNLAYMKQLQEQEKQAMDAGMLSQSLFRHDPGEPPGSRGLGDTGALRSRDMAKLEREGKVADLREKASHIFKAGTPSWANANPNPNPNPNTNPNPNPRWRTRWAPSRAISRNQKSSAT